MNSNDSNSNIQSPPSSPPRKRRSRRLKGTQVLAECIIEGKQILFITGAGLSVASGVRPFRGSSGLWANVIWKTATRQAFRKDPLKWYNEFWLPHFGSDFGAHAPNAGHDAIAALQDLFPSNVSLITQNVDGLHRGPVVECHGRVGLYKCIPAVDSDTDSDNDEDDDRPVHLGHRRKTRLMQEAMKQSDSTICPYQHVASLTVHQLEPPDVRDALKSGATTLPSPPTCPHCHTPCPPQALLFDEGYHSHLFYKYEDMEDMLARADVVVFVGTSFAVNITDVALTHAKTHGLLVFNFNTTDTLVPSEKLNVENIVGKSDETLVRLLKDVQALL